MGRILLQIVLPILLPTALYALWLVAERRRVEAGGTGKPPLWAEAPWMWLLALGVCFAALLMMALSLFGGDSTKGVYVAPHVENGEIVPGHVEQKAPAR
jgi:hypothetical protein